MAATPMTGGEALVRSLYNEGVRVIFGLPGVQLYGVMAALRDEPRIRFITTRHEQATSFMADGYARGGELRYRPGGAGSRAAQRPVRPLHRVFGLVAGADPLRPDPTRQDREG